MWFWLVVAPAALAGIQASPDKIFAGAATTITITLTAAAPPGGVPMTITQAPANRLQFVNPPASIRGGQSSVSFTAKSALGSPNTVVPVTITAAITGSPPSSVSRPTISQPGLTTPLIITPPSISPGGTASGLITLTDRGSPGSSPSRFRAAIAMWRSLNSRPLPNLAGIHRRDIWNHRRQPSDPPDLSQRLSWAQMLRLSSPGPRLPP